MKNSLYIAALAVILASCSNEDNTPSEESWNGEIRLSGSNEAVNASRSIAQDIQLSQFKPGESVDVFINEAVQNGQSPTATYMQPLTCTTEMKDGRMALSFAASQYFPQSGNGVNIFAVYPSKAAVNGVSSEAAFTVRSNQSADTDYMASDLMIGVPELNNPVAKTKESVHIKFAHKLSKIDVALESGDGKPSLQNATVKLKNLLPATRFTPDSGILSAAEGNRTDIIAADRNIGASLECSAIIVPQTVMVAQAEGTPFIEVTLASGGVLTYHLKAKTEFKSGLKYVYKIKVNLTGLSVTSIITTWESGGTFNGEANM